MRRYRPATKPDAVNFALRFLASVPFNTHTPGAFCEVLEPARARELVRSLEFCYTPTHGRVAEHTVGASPG